MAADDDSPLEQLSTQEVRCWTLSKLGVAAEFVDAVPQLDRPARSAVVVDLDRDGDCDFLLGSLGTHRVEALERVGLTGRSVRVRLAAATTHTSAFGAQVLLETGSHKRAQVLAPVTGFQASGPRELIFGLGGEQSGALSVLWPGKSAFEPFGRVDMGGTYLLQEDTTQARRLVDELQPLGSALPEGVKLQVGDRPNAWHLLTVEGEPHELPFKDSGRPLVLHLVDGSSDLGFLSEAHVDSPLQDSEVIALALNADGWTEHGKRALSASTTGLTLDWGNAANLNAIDPSLDLYTLEMPTTLTFDRDGYLVGIKRQLRASASSVAKQAAR